MEGNVGIDTRRMVTHRTTNGWENQGKVLIWVLYDRDCIDESGVTKYRVRVVDEDGELIPQLLLINMMETSPEYTN